MWLLFLRQPSFSLLRETSTPLRCAVVSHLTQFTNIYYSLYGSALVERCVCCAAWKRVICETDLFCCYYWVLLQNAFLRKIKTLIPQNNFKPNMFISLGPYLTTPISLSYAFVKSVLKHVVNSKKTMLGECVSTGTQLNLLTFCSNSI